MNKPKEISRYESEKRLEIATQLLGYMIADENDNRHESKKIDDALRIASKLMSANDKHQRDVDEMDDATQKYHDGSK